MPAEAKPDVVTYSALIHAAAVARDLPAAMGMFEDMQLEGIKPNPHTYSSLIKATESEGQWRTALELHAQMQKAGIRPTVVTYSAVISVLDSVGVAEQAIEVFNEMTRAGLDPDVVAYTAVMNAYKRVGQSERAFQVTPHPDCTPSPRACIHPPAGITSVRVPPLLTLSPVPWEGRQGAEAALVSWGTSVPQLPKILYFALDMQINNFLLKPQATSYTQTCHSASLLSL